MPVKQIFRRWAYKITSANLGMIACLTTPLAALELTLPANAVRTAQREEVATVQPVPSGAFAGTNTQFLTAQGRVVHTAYSIASTSLTPFQMISPLQDQLETQGYRSTFSCADTVCGGFDFRYLLDLLPEPHMHVDLGNFQYLLAQDSTGSAVAVVTSRARTVGFVHVSHISSETDSAPLSLAKPNDSVALDTTLSARNLGPLAQRLDTLGSIPLDGLAFQTGSSQLGDGPFEGLQSLARYLAQNPNVRVVLVGHTDAKGSLSGNISLSRKRAAAVRERLVTTHGVDPAQVSAEGVGYLAPRASNATRGGRDKNRRVEAVLTSTP